MMACPASATHLPISGVAADVERGTIAGHLEAGVLDLRPCRLSGGGVDGALLAGQHLIDGLAQACRREHGGEPGSLATACGLPQRRSSAQRPWAACPSQAASPTPRPGPAGPAPGHPA